MPPTNQYMDLLNINDEEAVLQVIKRLASQLSDHDHLIRSCIFDLHAVIEIDLRDIFFQHFQSLLFITSDKTANLRIKSAFEKMIARLSFWDMWRVLKPIMIDWYPDSESIEEINNTRNAVAHANLDNVKYKGRSPFREPDCLCQMYFDVWATKQTMPRFTARIKRPFYQLRAYYQKYGDIATPQELRDEVDKWYTES
jgi:hypothetical protein